MSAKTYPASLECRFRHAGLEMVDAQTAGSFGANMNEEELKQIEEDCQQFKNVIKTVFYLVPMFFMAYVVWCNW